MRNSQKISGNNGRFGPYGGAFVPETLVPALKELEDCYIKAMKERAFTEKFKSLLKEYVGRPTPLYFAERLSTELGHRIYLKREDLCHTGAHKINNSLGQVMLAVRMRKKRIIAETGAGQHGVATATAAARFGLECDIYMGEIDMERQSLNVKRMELLGARVIPVKLGQKTLKEAVNAAIRDWVSNSSNTHYVLGSALGPHPFPTIVRNFQSCIGKECLQQIRKTEKRLPDIIIACVGGGSNAIGIFHPFLKFSNVKMIGVEAGGRGNALGEHATRFSGGRIGILQGTKPYVLQDDFGQIALTHSVSAGLDYAAIGPEHSFLRDSGRIQYISASDDEAIAGFQKLSQTEGILPALESAHAVAGLIKISPSLAKNSLIILNLSGRGDKDVEHLIKFLKNKEKENKT